MPRIRTGWSVNSEARSRGTMTTAAAPSLISEQSNTVSGSDIILPAKSLLHRDHLAHVRQRILRAIGVILHRHRRQVLARGSVLMHVPLGDHREQRWKRRARAAFAGHIPRPGQDFGDLGRRLRGHLLDPRHQDDIVQPGRHARNRVEECRAAGGAGRFKSGAWYPCES